MKTINSNISTIKNTNVKISKMLILDPKQVFGSNLINWIEPRYFYKKDVTLPANNTTLPANGTGATAILDIVTTETYGNYGSHGSLTFQAADKSIAVSSSSIQANNVGVSSLASFKNIGSITGGIRVKFSSLSGALKLFYLSQASGGNRFGCNLSSSSINTIVTNTNGSSTVTTRYTFVTGRWYNIILSVNYISATGVLSINGVQIPLTFSFTGGNTENANSSAVWFFNFSAPASANFKCGFYARTYNPTDIEISKLNNYMNTI